jgi:hypothetical protein
MEAFMSVSPRISRRVFCAAGLPTLASTVLGCGTILYPERRGQPAGRLDWGIVALDAVGLLLFFVPGVIAFAVDFSNGTIYLPHESFGSLEDEMSVGTTLRACRLESDRPSLADIESVVERETQVTLSLQDESVLSKPLNSLKEFWAEVGSLRSAA